MRIVRFLGEHINIQMSVLTPFFYKQQFNIDFSDDLLLFLTEQQHTIGQRLVWAMSKTADFDLIDFSQWIHAFEQGETNWVEILQEINRYFANFEIKEDSKKEPIQVKHYETKVIGTSLKLGFSFDSLKYILPSDLDHLFDDENEPQKATQEDIDMLLA